MGVAQKTTFSIDSRANSKRGVSRALIEHIEGGIGFITILPLFGLKVKTTSFPSPKYATYSLTFPFLFKDNSNFINFTLTKF